MKTNRLKKSIASSMVISMLVGSIITSNAVIAQENEVQAENNEVVILHTNDTHCAIDENMGFAGVAAYKNDMEAIYGAENVTLVDAGDAVQGGAIGKLTQGEEIINLMNMVGYDIFTPGNHEFDYQMPQFFNLMGELDAKIISSNFMDLKTGESVYDGYDIVDYGEFEVGYVGITTPETITKTSPLYFEDEDGNMIYGFCQGSDGQELYNNVQESVDKAIVEGADYIIAVAHLGVDEGSNPYRSTDVIANTTGIDVMLDGHSHTVIDDELVTNKNGEEVILSQTGSKFEYLGKVTIDNEEGTITSELIAGDSETGYTKKDETVQAEIDRVNKVFEEMLNKEIGYAQEDLVTNDPKTEEFIIRHEETNLGDFTADAYKEVLEADVAIVNAGGIRADIEEGEVTYGDIIDVHPYGNNAMSIKVTGQMILDALEMGSRNTPGDSGSFLQVSGMTYKINTDKESNVVVNDEGSFVEVDGEYRVYDVMIGGEPLDLEKEYILASHDYLIVYGGDGLSMFSDAEVVKDKYMIDSELLITYIQDNLNGVIGSEYSNPYGQGRIEVVNKAPEEPTEPTTVEPTEEPTDEAPTEEQPTEESTSDKTEEVTTIEPTQENTKTEAGTTKTGDIRTEQIALLSIMMIVALGVIVFIRRRKKT